MIVTKITELDKKKCKIETDEEFAFVLYKGELRLYGIEEGKELSEESCQELFEKVLPKRAKLRAMNLLKTRDYTEKALADKLRQGGYPIEIIEEAVEYVKAYHYVDDLRYARSYINYNIESKSYKQIEQFLAQKGIDKETRQRAWDELKEEGNSQDEIAMIQKLLAKKHYDKDSSDIKEKQKIQAFLFRKGFSTDSIIKAMDMDFSW